MIAIHPSNGSQDNFFNDGLEPSKSNKGDIDGLLQASTIMLEAP